jgi:hypothetical protein
MRCSAILANACRGNITNRFSDQRRKLKLLPFQTNNFSNQLAERDYHELLFPFSNKSEQHLGSRL